MKKVIAIIAVIAAITACFCIGASAFEVGETIPAGTKIQFNDSIDFESGAGLNWTNVKYKSNNIDYTAMYIGGDDCLLNYGNTTVYNNGSWINQRNRTITITEDFEIPTTSSNGWHLRVLRFLNQGQIIEPTIEKVTENTKATFSATLFVGSLLISWLVANQICLVGLYLYIMIALAATGRRFIKGA